MEKPAPEMIAEIQADVARATKHAARKGFPCLGSSWEIETPKGAGLIFKWLISTCPEAVEEGIRLSRKRNGVHPDDEDIAKLLLRVFGAADHIEGSVINASVTEVLTLIEIAVWAVYQMDVNEESDETPEGLTDLTELLNDRFSPLPGGVWSWFADNWLERLLTTGLGIKEAMTSDGHLHRYFKHAGTYRRPRKKTGRNAPCGCGSGKKWKRCCGRRDG